jgi:hypothetical protein
MHIEAGILALVLAGAGWSADARAAANGFKFGEGRVHPYFQLESRYDSAATFDANTRVPVADLILHFKPGVKLEMPSPKFSVNLDGFLDYLLYTGLVSPNTSSANRLQGDADLDIGLNRGGHYGLDVGDHLMRSDRVSNPTVSVGVLSFYNDARAQVNLRPSGGAMELSPNYHLTTETYQPLGAPNSTVSTLDYLTHTFALAARWKFLPKTAFTLDGAFAMRDYLTSGSSNTPINALKATVGLAGLVSTHITTVLKVGWGQDFNSEKTFGAGSNQLGLIGQAELGYLLSETGQIKIGFVRTFEPVAGAFVSYADNRGYLDARVLLGGRLTLRGTGSADFLNYAKVPAGEANSATNLSLDAGADFEIVRWLSVSGGYVLTYRQGAAAAPTTETSFTRNEVYARIQLIY